MACPEPQEAAFGKDWGAPKSSQTLMDHQVGASGGGELGTLLAGAPKSSRLVWLADCGWGLTP